jgi:hypothetical protein
LRGRRDIEDANISNGDALADEVEINLNILCALMLGGVGGEVGSADVVAADEGNPRQGLVQLLNKLTEPAHHCHVVGHDAVLCLSTRTGDDVSEL